MTPAQTMALSLHRIETEQTMEVELTPAPGTAYLGRDQVRALDLQSLAASLRSERDRQEGSFPRTTLVKTPEVRVVAALLSQGERLEDREASRPVAIQVVDGEIRVQLGEEVLYARSGELLALPAASSFSVEAVRESSLLLIASESPAPEGMREVPDGTVTVEWEPALQELTAAEVMNPAVVALAPGTPLNTIVEQLAEYRISAAPVINVVGEVIGMVSETDLIDEEKRRVRLPRTLLFGVFPILEEAVRGAYDEGLNLTARDLMTHPVFVAPEDLPARQVADEMIARKINHVPVTRNGRLVGIIARADLLRAMQAGRKQ
jgi:CBS domain-containing protein/quercetin dioxygenase-like cupin family protein